MLGDSHPIGRVVVRRLKCRARGTQVRNCLESPAGSRYSFCAALGPYASGVYKPNWSKSGPKTGVQDKVAAPKTVPYRTVPYRVPNRTEPTDTYKPYRTGYGEASRLARGYATCQEPCGGARNCTRYEDRTVRRTVPNLHIPTIRTVQDAEKRLRTRPL